MCKIIQFPKEYKKSDEFAIDMDKQYEKFYSDLKNYKVDTDEWKEYWRNSNKKHKKTMKILDI